MNFCFDNDKENFLKLIVKSARSNNIRVFFVGGIVRDNILGYKTSDIDILINGSAIEFAKKLPQEIKVKSIHPDFDTVKLLYKNEIIDIASSRTEHYPFSGCLPVVQKIGVPIEEDVKRRDFTINSIYCELYIINNKLSYKLIDLVEGIKDINSKTLRVLHDKSYIDDPTRILRGVEFAFRFNFDFSQHDKTLIENYLSSPIRTNMSVDRVLSVFSKIFKNKPHKEIFKKVILNKYYKILFDDVQNIDFNLVDNVLDLFSDEEFKTDDFYISLLKNQEFEILQYNSKKELFYNMKNMKKAVLACYYYKTQDKNVLWFVKNKDFKFLITGDDLINLGFKQGKIFSQIFEKLFDAKISNPQSFISKENEIDWVKNNFKS